jgi:hypothetical protein
MSFSYPRGKGPKEHLNGDSIKRTRGRPKGSGMNPDRTVASIRIRAATKVMLDGIKLEYNCKTYDDAIIQYLHQRINLRKKADALQGEIEGLKSQLSVKDIAYERLFNLHQQNKKELSEYPMVIVR